MNWVVTGLLVVVVMVVSIINATRIERIRTDVNTASNRVSLPETESMLIRGESGDRLPKKAYWLKVNPDPNPTSDKEVLDIDHGDNSRDTDGTQFDADVINLRVRYVYRADQRAMFSIRKEGGQLILEPLSSSSLRFVTPGTTEPKKMTVIGLPEALVTATASSV